MLKFIKNLSMLSTTLDSLQNSNAIDVLIELLNSNMNQPHFREMSNQILNTIYNLCRLSKPRQEDAALNGIIPLLQKIVKTERPLKEFALPILCDMAHSGKVGRRELWRNKGLAFYISLLSDPYWQVTALDAIFTWSVSTSPSPFVTVAELTCFARRLQEETAKVEEHLTAPPSSFTTAIIHTFTISKTHAFENLLDPLQKLLRLSPPCAASLARPDLFTRIVQKLGHGKAAIRLNLLRIVRSICDSCAEGGGGMGALLREGGLLEKIRELELGDPAVLVRNMAGELVKSCEESDGISGSGGTKRKGAGGVARRTSSSTTPPHLLSSHSIPSTPQVGAGRLGTQQNSFFDTRVVGHGGTPHRQRVNGINGSLALRPTSRDGNSPVMQMAGNAVAGAAGMPKSSRLPRTTGHRLSKQSSATRESIGGLVERQDSRGKTPVGGARPPSSVARNGGVGVGGRARTRMGSGDSQWS